MEVFHIYHLHQVEKVSEVCAELICRPIVFFIHRNVLVFDLRLPQLHGHLSDCFCDTDPLLFWGETVLYLILSIRFELRRVNGAEILCNV